VIHHDPDGSDDVSDEMVAAAAGLRQSGIVTGATEGLVLEV
jgi:hypothetical protein